jgi:arginase
MTIPVGGSTHDDARGGQNSDARTYRIFGVPFRTGSLYPGSENDAQPYRDAGLIARLEAAGCRAVDEGDVTIPSYLPHHTIPPIRNWPGPRIVWDCVTDALLPVLERPGHVPLLIGCDCSIVVGTAQALMRAAAEDLHVIYVDGDFDDAPPRADRYQSGAAMALWLLTQPSPFWTGPAIDPARVTVIGWTAASQLATVSGAAPPVGSTMTGKSKVAVKSAPRADAGPAHAGMGSVSLDDLRRTGARAAARQVLDAIPDGARILIHIDIDVFARHEMPAAYFPHDHGLTLAEGAELLDVLLKDDRISIIEVTEYAALRDADQQAARQLVELLATGLGGGRQHAR